MTTTEHAARCFVLLAVASFACGPDTVPPVGGGGGTSTTGLATSDGFDGTGQIDPGDSTGPEPEPDSTTGTSESTGSSSTTTGATTTTGADTATGGDCGLFMEQCRCGGVPVHPYVECGCAFDGNGECRCQPGLVYPDYTCLWPCAPTPRGCACAGTPAPELFCEVD